MKSLLLFCFVQLLLFSAIGQEKRLALVIGNSNYDKGALKNPVNDALLMKETLEKLNFEVILDTNLRTRGDLLNSINLFGEKRKNYSVGFVYYAGHGVQIDGNNYILATKEKYDSKINVKDNGVNVDRFLEYFELAKNEINILILDACRNNPFEKNWLTSSRSLENGLGLAPPKSSGNIIAFSTSAGTTASDGNEKAKNSSYCLSLVKNMMTPDLDLDQIFRNVRKEVREISGGNQLPTVDNHYEGSDFYFRKSTYTDQIIEIDSLIDAKDYEMAKEKVTEVLTKVPNNKLALLRRGRIEYNSKNRNYDGFHLFKADSLYPNDPEVYEYIGRYYSTIGEVEKAIKYMDNSIKIDPNNPKLFYWRARFFEENKEQQKAENDYTQSLVLDSTVTHFFNRASFYERTNNFEKALTDYTKAISMEKENPKWYNARANCYILNKDFTAALKDLDKAIDLAPNDPYYYNNRADFYKFYKTEYELALKDYATALKLSKDSYQSARALNNRALIYRDQEKFDLAIEEQTKALEIYPIYSLYYSNRAEIYQKQQNYELALSDYTQAISMEKGNPRWYEERANCFMAKEDFTAALKDLDKAIDLAPNFPDYYNNRADFYKNYKNEAELALEDYEIALKLSKDSYQSARALNNRALIYKDQEKFDLAIEEYTKALEIYPNEPLILMNRAEIYQKQQNYELALSDYSQAISFDKGNPRWYEERANCYIAKEDFTAALKDLDKAIDLAPNDPAYYNNRADFYREYKNDVDLALKDYASALKLSKDAYQSARALNNRAIIYEIQEKFDLAIEEYTKAIEIYPNSSLNYSNRAEIYQKQQNYELALSDYTQAISMEKGNPRWYEERANCFMAKEDFTAALKDLDKAIDLAPNFPDYYNNRADFYKNYKNEAELALEDYEIALKLSKDSYQSARALNNRALIYKDQEKFDLAIEEYTKALEIYPNEPLILMNRAEIYQKQQNYELALSDYSQAISFDKGNPRWYEERANCYIAKEDFTAALKDLDKAIDLAPNDPAYYNNRADFYREYKNDVDLALKDYASALKLSKDAYQSARALNNRAIIYEIQEKFDLAIEEYTKAIEIYPNYSLNYSNRAGIYQKQQNYELALADYTKAIQIEPQNAYHYYVKGALLENFMNKPYDALVEYSIGLSKDSLATYIWWRRGLLFSNELNDHKSAIRDYQYLLKIDSNDVSVLNWLGVLYGRLGEDSIEFDYYNRTLFATNTNFKDKVEFNVNLAWSCNNLAYYYQKENNNSKSLEFYNKAIELDPMEPLRHYERAWFRALYLDDYTGSINDINNAIKCDEKNNYWLLQRAKLNLIAQKKKEAKNDFLKLVNDDKNSVSNICELANFYSITKENESADFYFKKAKELDSNSTKFLHMYTDHLIRNELWEMAIKKAQKAIEKNKLDTIANYQLGKIYLSNKNLQTALSSFLEAENIIELSEKMEEIDESDESQIFLSDIQKKISEIYSLLAEGELSCLYINKAIQSLNKETRSKKSEHLTELNDLKVNCQN